MLIKIYLEASLNPQPDESHTLNKIYIQYGRTECTQKEGEIS